MSSASTAGAIISRRTARRRSEVTKEQMMALHEKLVGPDEMLSHFTESAENPVRESMGRLRLNMHLPRLRCETCDMYCTVIVAESKILINNGLSICLVARKDLEYIIYRSAVLFCFYSAFSFRYRFDLLRVSSNLAIQAKCHWPTKSWRPHFRPILS